jgi:hydroxymethylpyrimidine/phosphomethylpyrimidine kinase
VRALGPSHVVVTGGHSEGDDSIDHYTDGERVVPIPGPRYPGGASHGSGCTHSSALAAHLALGAGPLEAAVAAKAIAAEGVLEGLREIGAGPGPVDVLGVGARAARRGGRASGTPPAAERAGSPLV